MQLRRIAPFAGLVALLAGCEPSIPQTSPSSPSVNYVVFDPATSQIPLPNDLALLTAPTGAPKNAGEELLQTFAAQKGFPNDQEVPITIDVQQETTGGNPVKSPPASGVDVTTLTPSTFLVLEKKAGATTYAPFTDWEAAYVKKADRGTLEVHRKLDPVTKSRRWNAGSSYVAILRGGPNGAKLAGGGELIAMPAMYLLTRGENLMQPQYEKLLPGTPEEQVALAAQLETVRQQYLPLFAAVQAPPPNGFGWGSTAAYEIVAIQTFAIAPTVAPQVVFDASAGVVPLPSDLLLDPATGGKTVVNNPAFGPAAAGLATLDGFSTTAMLLSQTSAPIVMASVNKDTVFLYDLSDPAHPVRVKELSEGAGAGFVAEPYAIGQTNSQAACPGPTNTDCFSTAIGLQPAVPIPTPAGSGLPPYLTLPPLKEKTEYAVIITNGVVAATVPNPTPLQPATVSKILLFQNALVDASGKSQLPGTDDATAGGLEKMRQGIGAALAALSAEKPAIAKSKVAAAYTFRTQSITQTVVDLAAAPYGQANLIVPGTPVALCGGASPAPACASGTGLPTALPAVQELLVVPVPTLDPIDKSTGAFNPNTAAWGLTSLNAYVFLPANVSALPACPGAAAQLRCAPLVIFKHGLLQAKGDVFWIANRLASAGFVVAAIDAPLHGDRSYCTQNAECTCPPWNPTCTATCQLFPSKQPTDPVLVGQCAGGSVANPQSSTNPSGIPGLSGKFILTTNFFRSRDALREDVLDTSSLILALSPPTPVANAFTNELAAKGIGIDGTKVSLIALSMGGTHGVMSLAGNPRIGRAVLTSAGGTTMDIVTHGKYGVAVNPLLGTPGTADYLKTLQVAKWILDPAEPLNFASHLLGNTLPSPLSGNQPPPAKNILGQYAFCDQTVQNPYEEELYRLIGLTPTPTGPNAFTTYQVAGALPVGTCVTYDPSALNPHSFLIEPLDPIATQAAQDDVANYLLNLTTPAKATRP